MGMMKTTHAHAMQPHGTEKRPRFHGPVSVTVSHWDRREEMLERVLPGRNFPLAAVSRRAMGMVKAVYWAMAPMLKTAPMATGDANMRRPKALSARVETNRLEPESLTKQSIDS